MEGEGVMRSSPEAGAGDMKLAGVWQYNGEQLEGLAL